MEKGGEIEFRSFMESRWPRMVRGAYLLTGNRHDAEELAQTALARAYSRWGRVSNARDPDAYVWRIMINANADRMRSFSVREWLTNRFPERAAADRTEQFAVRTALVEALGRLPARQRAVVVLRYLEERTETEVAEILGVGVGTVRSQTARALTRLRRDGALRDEDSEVNR